jgi:hypothetical protein
VNLPSMQCTQVSQSKLWQSNHGSITIISVVKEVRYLTQSCCIGICLVLRKCNCGYRNLAQDNIRFLFVLPYYFESMNN